LRAGADGARAAAAKATGEGAGIYLVQTNFEVTVLV